MLSVLIMGLILAMFATFLVFIVQDMKDGKDKDIISTIFIILISLGFLGFIKLLFTSERMTINKETKTIDYSYNGLFKKYSEQLSTEDIREIRVTARAMKDGQPVLDHPQNSWIFALVDKNDHEININHGSFVHISAKDEEKARIFVKLVTLYLDAPINAPWIAK